MEPENIRILLQKKLFAYPVNLQVNLTQKFLVVVINRSNDVEAKYDKIVSLIKKSLAGINFQRDSVQILGRVEGSRIKEFEKIILREDIDKILAKKEAKKRQNSQINPKLSSSTEICCPKCKSTQVQAFQKGFGWGKAVGGALLVGPLGLAAGGIGSKKIMLGCLACGHRWQASRK